MWPFNGIKRFFNEHFLIGSDNAMGQMELDSKQVENYFASKPSQISDHKSKIFSGKIKDTDSRNSFDHD